MRRPFPPWVAKEFRESRDTAETFDKAHGRLETRRLVTSTILNEHLDRPDVGQVCQIKRMVRQQDASTTEVEDAITSVPRAHGGAATILQWWRGHWGIENRLHWVRDMTFGEDASRIRTGAAPQILAAIRNAVIGMLRSERAVNIAETLRQNTWKPQRLFAKLGRWNK